MIGSDFAERETLPFPSKLHINEAHEQAGAKTMNIAKEPNSRLGSSLDERAVTLRRDIRALDSMLLKISDDKHLASEIFMAAEIEQEGDFKLLQHARDLLELTKARMKLRWNYMKLFSLLFSFGLYCTAILLQRGDSAAYEIESR